jgi:hypothetical protein
MAKMLSRCPVCEGALKITELNCTRCNAKIQSSFDSCRFCNLPAEHLAFVEIFLKCEGNLSRVEKELGVSYPTVRNRLTGALSALGFNGSAPEPASASSPPAGESGEELPSEDTSVRRRDALNALARGEISADDAARVLRELS